MRHKNWNKLLRSTLLKIGFIGACVACVQTTHAAVLSGAFVFGIAPSGQSTGNAYDTRPEGPLYNLIFGINTTNGITYLNGPDNSRASINILLHAGTNRFLLFQDGCCGVGNNYGVNLFLDGHILPDISAKSTAGSQLFTTNRASDIRWASGANRKIEMTSDGRQRG